MNISRRDYEANAECWAELVKRRFGEADPPHGRGVMRGAKVGNGVAVGAGVAVAAGLCVATCACAPAKKATKPTRTHTRTHTLRKAIPDRIRVLVAGCRS
jgi:hypothetical protein